MQCWSHLLLCGWRLEAQEPAPECVCGGEWCGHRGTLSDQLFFGWLGDKLGGKKVYSMTFMLMVICSIGSGLSFSHDVKIVMATLCFFRFWLGFEIGGDHPLCTTIMPEYANKKTRGAFIVASLCHAGFRDPSRWHIWCYLCYFCRCSDIHQHYHQHK